MNSIIGIFEELLTNFTLKRLFALLFLIVFAYIVFVFYDAHTGSFELGRLQRATDLLEQLHTLQSRGISNNLALAAIHSQVISELTTILEIPTSTAPAKPSNHFLLKFGATSLPWLILSLFLMYDTIKKGEQVGNSALGLFAIIIFFALIGGFIPTIKWPWFNLLVYPFLQFVILAIIAIPVGLKSFKKARQVSLKKQGNEEPGK